jgi:hypothetical protein
MKKYVKAQVVAKNSPEGSYAAGCPVDGSRFTSNGRPPYECRNCERTQ